MKYMKKKWQSICDYIKQQWLAWWAWLKSNFDLYASILSFVSFWFFYWFFDLDLLDRTASTSNTEEARNFIIIFGLFFGFPILIKRVAEMQKQTRISQFGDASRFLWDQNNGARMASIAALWMLAEEYPKQEYKKVMRVFTDFLKHPPPYELDEDGQKPTLAGKRKDIAAILDYMQRKTIKGVEKFAIDFSELHLEGANLFLSHLEGANLMGSYLEGADLRKSHLEGAYLLSSHLEGADLSGSHLEGAYLLNSHLDGANLEDSHLEGADLSLSTINGADLSGSHLEGANLSLSTINGADFTDAIELTQEQIDRCLFITDGKEQEHPKLPGGITPSYKKMTHEEWEKKMGEILRLAIRSMP